MGNNNFRLLFLLEQSTIPQLVPQTPNDSMKLTLVVFVAVLVSLSAIRAKPSNTSKLQAEGKKFVASRLSEFNKVAKKPQLSKEDRVHFVSLLKYVKKAQANNYKISNEVMEIVARMNEIVFEGVSDTASRELKKLTAGINGKRYNPSYYVLDYTTEWIDKRLPATNENEILKKTMTEIRDHLKAARDALDKNAKEFVQGVKKIKELTSMGKGADNSKDIKNIIDNLTMGAGDITYVNETDFAVDLIKKAADV